MDLKQIGALLQPFLSAPALASPARLSPGQLQNISTYIDLLLKWNARFNLTAIRDPQDIVTRHFGESLFLAAYLFPSGRLAAACSDQSHPLHALDFGSGAGFPGVPLKLYVPSLRLTLAESNHKKAAFLAEVIRTLKLRHAAVYTARIGTQASEGGSSGLPPEIAPPDLVTMRAVERFEAALSSAAALLRGNARGQGTRKLTLLVGSSQAEAIPALIPDFLWEAPVPVPGSRHRVLLVGRYPHGKESDL